MINVCIGDIVKYREPYTGTKVTCEITNIHDSNGQGFMRFDGRVIDSSAFIDSENCSGSIYDIRYVNGKEAQR